MILSDQVLQHIKEKSKNIEHGEVCVIFKGTDKEVDVVVKDRTRFPLVKQDSKDFRKG